MDCWPSIFLRAQLLTSNSPASGGATISRQATGETRDVARFHFERGGTSGQVSGEVVYQARYQPGCILGQVALEHRPVPVHIKCFFWVV